MHINSLISLNMQKKVKLVFISSLSHPPSPLQLQVVELDSEVSRVQALLRQREQEVQHVSQVAAKLTSERDHVADVVRQEFADRLAIIIIIYTTFGIYTYTLLYVQLLLIQLHRHVHVHCMHNCIACQSRVVCL